MSRSLKRILWFSPTAGLWPSAELENDLANAWQDAGHQVTVIRCGGILNSYCAVMYAEGIPASASAKRKEVACQECRFNSFLLDLPDNSLYDTLLLDNFVTSQAQSGARNVVRSLSKSNWSDLHRGGIPLGRYTSYLTLLDHKVLSPAAHEESWQEYLLDLYNSVVLLDSLPDIFEKTQPDLVAVYNPLYPLNRVFVEYAKKLGIPMVNIASGSYIPDRYSSIALYSELYSSQTVRDSKNIQDSLCTPLSTAEITGVTRQVSHLMLGVDPWVYSTAPSVLTTDQIRLKLGLRPLAPVVVALVGSPDETRSSALVDNVYERTQAELSTVIEFVEQVVIVARSMPDIDFVVRLHPRLSSDKRVKIDSPDLVNILQILRQRPSNVHVNEAVGGISLYDTARIASAGLNQSSTSGLEFLVLGIPVVQYDPPRINAYPPEFGVQVKRLDQAELQAAIHSVLATGWSLENSRSAYRWFAVTLMRSVIHRRPIGLVQSDSGVNMENEKSTTTAATQNVVSIIRQLVPQSIREKVSRQQARSQREEIFNRERKTGDSNQDWRSEAFERLADLTPGGILEPLIFQRGEALTPESELAAINEEVLMLIDKLGGLEINKGSG